MAKIRAYICNWQLVDNRVTNPISDYVDSLETIPGFKWVSHHYSEALPDGTPGSPFCIAFVKADDFTDFDAVANTVKLPQGNLSESLSNQQRNGIINAIRGKFNIPRGVLSSAANRKDIITKLAKHIHPSFQSMGNHIKDEDFE